MFCKNCGSQISDDAVVCPNCGVATEKLNQSTAYAQAPAAKTNTIAIVGFVLSFFSAIIGLICSIIGYKQAGTPEYNGNGKGLALAGIIISCISTAVYLILVITLVAGAACIAGSL